MIAAPPSSAPVLPRVTASSAHARSLTLSWRGLLTALLVVIFFVPIRRYTLPIRVGFELEPYRVVVGFTLLGWIASLLVDPSVRLRRSGFERPLGLIAFAVLGSIALNTGSISALGVSSDVLKSVTFFASFVLLLYLVLSVVSSREQLDALIKVVVGSAAVVAALAVVEWRTGSNLFNHLRTVFPFLKTNVVPNPQADITGFTRGGHDRVFASAEHPIALGAALVLVLPLALYLVCRTRRWWWGFSAAAIAIGVFATISRTPMVMLLVVALTFLVLRPRQTLRLWPAIVPILLVIHFVLPSTLGILRSSLFPTGGVQALAVEQGSTAGSKSGRIAKIRPTLDKVSRDPLLGVGFGSQVVKSQNGIYTAKEAARILDDQWLGTLLETGFAGVIAWIWLFGSFLRRLGRAARADASDTGWLFVALTSSIAAFAASMFLYDAFAFVQVTFILFLLLSFGAVLLRAERASAAPAR